MKSTMCKIQITLHPSTPSTERFDRLTVLSEVEGLRTGLLRACPSTPSTGLRAGFAIFTFFIFCSPLWAIDPAIVSLEEKPIDHFDAPKIQVHRFKNGLKLFFLEDRELPLFEMQALIQVGGTDEPEESLGLASMMMSGIRTGGSHLRTGDEVDQVLEDAAVRLTSSSEREYSTLRIHSLIKDLDLSLSLFFDLLENAAFDPQKLEITRTRMLEGIRRRNEEAASIAGREFNQQLYGEGNVWARLPSEETVSNISHGDVVDFYKGTIKPNRVRIAVSGQIGLKDFIKKVSPYLANWNPGDVNFPPKDELKKIWRPSVHVIEKEVNQSAIVVGHFGERRFNPDKYALVLANMVLGGATFGSRLGARIRTDLGLAYSVGSQFGFETDYGPFKITAGTKTESTGRVVSEIKKVLEDMRTKAPITEEELEHARKIILTQLIFQYEDPFNLVTTDALYDFFDYPPDYISIYQSELKKVTLDQVRRVVREYFYPDRLKVMIVGDRKEMGDLSGLGKITELPLDND